MGVHWERIYAPENLRRMNIGEIRAAHQRISRVLQNYRDNSQDKADEAMIATLETVLANIEFRLKSS